MILFPQGGECEFAHQTSDPRSRHKHTGQFSKTLQSTTVPWILDGPPNHCLVLQVDHLTEVKELAEDGDWAIRIPTTVVIELEVIIRSLFR